MATPVAQSTKRTLKPARGAAAGAAAAEVGAAAEAEGPTAALPPPAPGWRHCSDGGYVRLQGTEAADGPGADGLSKEGLEELTSLPNPNPNPDPIPNPNPDPDPIPNPNPGPTPNPNPNPNPNPT